MTWFAFCFNFPQILPKVYSAGVLCSLMSSQKGRGHQDDANVAKYSESSAVSDTKAVVEGIKSYQVRFQGSDEQFGSESDWLPCSKIDGQHDLPRRRGSQRHRLGSKGCKRCSGHASTRAVELTVLGPQ
jgi:hypothetical protein